MHIIIDGYNVLKQVLHNGQISDSQRRAFINMLAKYGKKKNHTIIIVFDGGDSSWPTQEKDHGVSVIYAGIHQTADDLIQKYMGQKPHGLLIVSSDNEIKRAAHSKNIISIDALEFYMLLRNEIKTEKDKKQHTLAKKTTNQENELLDSLMRADTQPVYKPEEIEDTGRDSKGRTFSKKERAYLQKIKKL